MSDKEIDDELLAMAGGDSSDSEGEDEAKPSMDASRSPSEAPAQSVEKVEEPNRKGVAQKVRAKRGGARRRRKEESEEEEGEASQPSSPNSLGSGAMDESDSDAPGSPASNSSEAPLYPVEGKFQSSADRDHILSLPEIEREEILAERAQEVLKRNQDLQLRKALASSKLAASKHKRKAAEELEDGARKTSRPKVTRGEPTALDAYKKARESRGTDRNRLDSRRDRRDERSPSDGYSDADAEGSEVEWAVEPTSDRRDEPTADLKDFERCRVGRTNFAKVCFYPTFEAAIKGCFCRVSIGINRETGQNMYRMAQIKGFQEGRPYAMEGPNGKSFITDQYALVAHGKAEKPWPFLACSDSRITEQEFDRYTATLQKENLRLPMKKFLVTKLDDIHALLNHSWTEDDIERKISRAREMQRKFDNYSKDKIVNRRNEAASRGDTEAVTKCDAELAALANGSQVVKAASSSTAAKASPAKIPVQHERLAALNKANRKANAEEVRKAQLAEKRALQKARDEAAKARAAAEEEKKARMLEVPHGDMRDLFGDGSDISRAATPLNGSGTPRRGVTPRSGTPLNGSGKRERGVGTKKKSMEDEIIASMDLGIDIEI